MFFSSAPAATDTSALEQVAAMKSSLEVFVQRNGSLEQELSAMREQLQVQEKAAAQADRWRAELDLVRTEKEALRAELEASRAHADTLAGEVSEGRDVRLRLRRWDEDRPLVTIVSPDVAELGPSQRRSDGVRALQLTDPWGNAVEVVDRT